MRRCLIRHLMNVSGESPSPRAKPGMMNWPLEVQNSPYKEQFKEYWAQPIPFAAREYGEKPKIGDPVPTRAAVSTMVVARNKYADMDAVKNGADNDYKVLFMFRESKGQFIKDQFVLPSFPVHLEDKDEDWVPLLRRRGCYKYLHNVRKSYHHPGADDRSERITAMRALLALTNLLLVPENGGNIAEVEGPPGGKKWHLMIHQSPKILRNLIDVLELPMEEALSQLLPFRRVVTPESETFRFDNKSFLVTLDKIPEVQFTLSTVGERLVWASPMEAMARFNAGIFNMPTPNLILLSELCNECPTFDDVMAKKQRYREFERKKFNMGPAGDGKKDASAAGAAARKAITQGEKTPSTVGEGQQQLQQLEEQEEEDLDDVKIIRPILYHHGQEKVATVLLPGDFQHEDTNEYDRKLNFVRRLSYVKDWPYGVRAVFDERPAEVEELTTTLEKEKPVLLTEANMNDMVYESIPYPKRDTKYTRLHDDGEGNSTLYTVPQLTLQEGRENSEGFIPNRRQYNDMRSDKLRLDVVNSNDDGDAGDDGLDDLAVVRSLNQNSSVAPNIKGTGDGDNEDAGEKNNKKDKGPHPGDMYSKF